jgi:hypothetical protein
MLLVLWMFASNINWEYVICAKFHAFFNFLLFLLGAFNGFSIFVRNSIIIRNMMKEERGHEHKNT